MKPQRAKRSRRNDSVKFEHQCKNAERVWGNSMELGRTKGLVRTTGPQELPIGSKVLVETPGFSLAEP